MQGNSQALEIQADQVFLVPSFKNGVFFSGSEGRLFVAQGKAILEYNVFRRRWERSLVVNKTITDLFYDRLKQRLKVAMGNQILEFSPQNEVGFPVDSLVDRLQRPVLESFKEIPEEKLGWLTMPYPWFFSNKGIRDRYLQWFSIEKAGLLGTDDLFISTRGGGLFSGSFRHKTLKPLWGGLSYQQVHTLASFGDTLWVGGNIASQALTLFNTNLTNWESFYPSYESGLPHGVIRDIINWENRIVLGTGLGVSFFYPEENKFINEGVERGLFESQINSLVVWNGVLHAATPGGVYMRTGSGIWKTLSHPLPALRHNNLCANKEGLWSASQRGLYLYDTLTWTIPAFAKKTQGLAVSAVVCSDSLVVWADSRGLWYTKNGQTLVKEKPGILRMRMSGTYILAITQRSLYIFNFSNGLSQEISLGTYLPGTQIRDVNLGPDYLWVLTDESLARIDLRKAVLP